MLSFERKNKATDGEVFRVQSLVRKKKLQLPYKKDLNDNVKISLVFKAK